MIGSLWISFRRGICHGVVSFFRRVTLGQPANSTSRGRITPKTFTVRDLSKGNGNENQTLAWSFRHSNQILETEETQPFYHLWSVNTLVFCEPHCPTFLICPRFWPWKLRFSTESRRYHFTPLHCYRSAELMRAAVATCGEPGLPALFLHPQPGPVHIGFLQALPYLVSMQGFDLVPHQIPPSCVSQGRFPRPVFPAARSLSMFMLYLGWITSQSEPGRHCNILAPHGRFAKWSRVFCCSKSSLQSLWAPGSVAAPIHQASTGVEFVPPPTPLSPSWCLSSIFTAHHRICVLVPSCPPPSQWNVLTPASGHLTPAVLSCAVSWARRFVSFIWLDAEAWVSPSYRRARAQKGEGTRQESHSRWV